MDIEVGWTLKSDGHWVVGWTLGLMDIGSNGHWVRWTLGLMDLGLDGQWVEWILGQMDIGLNI